MKNHFLVILFIFLNLTGYSQINYEKGYYINNSGQKVDGFIKNKDWSNDPTEFDFKITLKTESNLLSIDVVKEFGVYGDIKYVRKTVNLDRSSNRAEKLSDKKEPKFETVKIFLKVLVDGEATLYSYTDYNLKRFFYKLKDSSVEPLVYKKYILSYNKVAENDKFKQQLFLSLKCSDITIKDLEKLRYKKNQLIELFVKYNQCQDSDYIQYDNQKSTKGKDWFNLNLRLGLNYSSATLTKKTILRDIPYPDFDRKLGLRLGLEAEAILPFNNNKWSIIFESTYQSYSQDNKWVAEDISGGSNEFQNSITYKVIEFALGGRHYFFLSDNSKIFVNSSFNVDFSDFFNDSVLISEGGGKYKTEAVTIINSYFGFGVGLKHDKYSIEFRFITNRDFESTYQNRVYWTSNFKNMSLIFGYTLF